MGQILAIDYGKARCGIAVTDDMQIIASGLETVENRILMEFLKKYFSENKVDEVVIGLPIDLKGNISEVETDILKFIEEFKKNFRILQSIVLMKGLPPKWLHSLFPKAEKTRRKDRKKD